MAAGLGPDNDRDPGLRVERSGAETRLVLSSVLDIESIGVVWQPAVDAANGSGDLSVDARSLELCDALRGLLDRALFKNPDIAPPPSSGFADAQFRLETPVRALVGDFRDPMRPRASIAARYSLRTPRGVAWSDAVRLLVDA